MSVHNSKGKRLRIASDYEPEPEQQTKCVKGGNDSEEDRIGQFPDEILAHIISFLTLKEAVVTSVLSRRWTDLWAFAARCLHFDHKTSWLINNKHLMKEKSAEKRKSMLVELFAMNRNRFIKQVNQVLKLHKSPTIEEFRVCVSLGEDFKSDIDEWLKFALTRRVQRLELYLTWFYVGSKPSYERPYSLKLPNSYVGFKSLKSLCLKRVDVSGQVLENILANCPVLERLFVHYSKELTSLKVAGPSLVLKYLEISWCFNINSIEICNVMNLVSLEYWGPSLNFFLINNVPRLVDLSVGGPVANSLQDFFPKLSCCLSQLETLALDVHQVEEFEGFDAPPQLPNLRKFILNNRFAGSDRCLLGYTSFIKASPFLQKFLLRVEWVAPQIDPYRRVRNPVKCRHEHLEEVELAGYYGRKCDRELVRYFLENATISLKRIIVRPCDQKRRYEEPTPTEEVIKREKDARCRAKEQLEGNIPPRVELIIL